MKKPPVGKGLAQFLPENKTQPLNPKMAIHPDKAAAQKTAWRSPAIQAVEKRLNGGANTAYDDLTEAMRRRAAATGASSGASAAKGAAAEGFAAKAAPGNPAWSRSTAMPEAAAAESAASRGMARALPAAGKALGLAAQFAVPYAEIGGGDMYKKVDNLPVQIYHDGTMRSYEPNKPTFRMQVPVEERAPSPSRYTAEPETMPQRRVREQSVEILPGKLPSGMQPGQYLPAPPLANLPQNDPRRTTHYTEEGFISPAPPPKLEAPLRRQSQQPTFRMQVPAEERAPAAPVSQPPNPKSQIQSPKSSIPNPKSQHLNTSTSIVDFMKSRGLASDYASRAKMAQRLGIEDYSGTAQQNIQMLRMLKGAWGRGEEPEATPQRMQREQPVEILPGKLPSGMQPGQYLPAPPMKLEAPLRRQSQQPAVAPAPESELQSPAQTTVGDKAFEQRLRDIYKYSFEKSLREHKYLGKQKTK